MQHLSFKDFIILQRGFDLPRSQMIDGPFPVVGSTSIIGYHNEYKIKPPGVVTGRSGSLGFVQYIKGPYWPHNTSLWVKDFKGNLPKYVYYYLKTLDLQRFNSGVGVPTLNRNDLGTLEISIHPINTQRKIAAILSAYDDLIENNIKRIRILEKTAQNLYREWFVHLRFPGHESVKMVDSPLGIIPEGWDVKKIGALLSYTIGGGWGFDNQIEENLIPAYVIRGTDIPEARYSNVSNCPLRFHKPTNLQSRIIRVNDIIFEVSGGSKDQPLGRSLLIGLNTIRSFDKDVMCASFCKLIRPNENMILPELLYLHFVEIYENKQIVKYQVQSTGLSNFKFTYFLDNESVLKPSHEIQDKFKSIINPILDTIQLLGFKNSNLRQARDLLLPKLISGELDVSELDIKVREPV